MKSDASMWLWTRVVGRRGWSFEPGKTCVNLNRWPIRVMSKLKVLRLVLSELIVADTRTQDVLESSFSKIQKAQNTSHSCQASMYSFGRHVEVDM